MQVNFEWRDAFRARYLLSRYLVISLSRYLVVLLSMQRSIEVDLRRSPAILPHSPCVEARLLR